MNDYATTASGVRTWLGDGSVDILLGTGNSSAIPNNTHIALEHGVGVHIRGGAWTNNAAGRQEGLHVCTGGNVGIGTASPQYPFHISMASPIIRLANSTASGASSYGWIEFGSDLGGWDRTGYVGVGSAVVMICG